MTIDIDKLRASLRAGLEGVKDETPIMLNAGQARSFLDHIDRLEEHVAKQQMDIVTLGAMAGRAEAAEAELARLRAPVEGEVGEMVEIVRLLQEWHRHAAEQASRDWDEQDEIRRLFKAAFGVGYRAADLLQRLSAQVAEANRDIDDFKRLWARAQMDAKDAEARLAEAVEVIALFRDRIAARGEWDDGCFYHKGTSASELQEPLTRASDFLAKMENPNAE